MLCLISQLVTSFDKSRKVVPCLGHTPLLVRCQNDRRNSWLSRDVITLIPILALDLNEARWLIQVGNLADRTCAKHLRLIKWLQLNFGGNKV